MAHAWRLLVADSVVGSAEVLAAAGIGDIGNMRSILPVQGRAHIRRAVLCTLDLSRDVACVDRYVVGLLNHRVGRLPAIDLNGARVGGVLLSVRVSSPGATLGLEKLFKCYRFVL